MGAKDGGKTPGPGSYAIPSRISENSKYGMAIKLNNDMSPMKNNPGPGHYDLQNLDNLNMNSS